MAQHQDMLELGEDPGLLWASWAPAMGRTGRGLYNPPFPVLVLEVQFLSPELSPSTHPVRTNQKGL